MSSGSATLPSAREGGERQPVTSDPATGGDAGIKPQSIYGTRKASLTLNIIVVGCGIGGLSAAFCLTQAGHRVTIIESSYVLGEIGAGILLNPNVSRLLMRWGLGKHLEEIAVKPEGAAFRRYSTNYQIHRADLHKLLYDLVAPHVTVLLGSPVVGCEPDSVSPSVTLESGEVMEADLIVGADGLKSYIQQVVLGKPNPAEPMGDAAYRATIPTSLMKQDPELRELIERPQLAMWVGPGRRMVTYLIRRKELLNIVLVHPDDGSIESWTATGDPDKMRRDFEDFEPRVRKLLGLVQSPLKFRLLDRGPLDKWIHDFGPVTLLGDACHPMLPYRAQGAAMAIEDAAVLGSLLSRISRRSQLRHLLQAYQDLRLDRTAMAQQASRRFRHIFHLPDGPEQRERDDNLRRTMELEASRNSKVSPDSSQNRRADADANDLFFRYDADAEADKWWADHGRELEIEAVARSSTLQSWWRFPWEVLWRLLASLYQFKPNAQV